MSSLPDPDRRAGFRAGGRLVGVGLVLAFPALLRAMDLPGGGAAPVPVARPGSAWLGYSNDNIGAPRYDQGDDFRTNRLWAGYQLTPWLRFGIDHGILTDGNPSHRPPDWSAAKPYDVYRAGARRIDQLSISAVVVTPFASAVADGEIWIGPGLRHTGQVGGATLQRRTHGLLGLDPVSIPYDDARDPWEPLAIGGADVRIGPGPHLWWRTDAISGPAAPLLIDAHLRLRWGGSRGAWWIGPGWRYRDDRNSQVTRAVAHHEEGFWLASGFASGPFLLSISQRLDGDGAMGSAGLVLGGDAAGASGAPRARGELGTAISWTQGRGKAVIAAALMDQPETPLAWGMELRRTQLKVPYHFDHRAESDEALLIGEWSRGAPHRGIGIDPFLRAGAGWYQGRVRVHGLPVTDETTIDAPRTRITSGIRTWWIADAWSVAISADVDWSWSPTVHHLRYDLPARGITERVGGGSPGSSLELGGGGFGSALRAVVGLAW